MSSGADQQLLEARDDEDADSTLWSKFTQQRLAAWQINLSPTLAIALYLLGGVAFFVLGFFLLLVSWGVEEHTLPYTDVELGHVSTLELTVPKDMEPPIWVYYELDGFHQNHRRYVKSKDNKQIEGLKPIRVHEDELSSCRPAVMGDGGRPLYPCGLVAHSVFNDTFALVMKGPGEEDKWTRVEVDSSARTIAWPADVDGGKFANYDPEGKHPSGPQNQELLDMWLIRRFPPVTCVQNSVGVVPYRPVYVSKREVTLPEDKDKGLPERKVEIADCKDYMTKPTCKFEDIHGQRITCSGQEYTEVPVPDWGLKSGHFMAWMRVAGLPNFRKLWGKVDDRLPKGTRLKVHVASHFPVSGFQGTKAVVLSTSSSLGGRNDFLGKGYLFVGLLCLIFGAWFLWKHISPGAP